MGTVSVTDGFNLVCFWDVSSLNFVTLLQMNLPCLKVNEQAYPLMFSVAIDIWPVQASLVPCEHLFSSGKETCTDDKTTLFQSYLRFLEVLSQTILQP